AADPPVTHALDVVNMPASRTISPKELIDSASFISAGAKTTFSGDTTALRIESDGTKYGAQLISSSIALEKHHDYLLRIPLKLEDGRVVVKITDGTQARLF